MDIVGILANERLRLEALKYEAIALCGTQQKLADKLGVNRQAVNKWLHGGKITHEHVLHLDHVVKMLRENPDDSQAVQKTRVIRRKVQRVWVLPQEMP